ncbi:MAG: hypothetical protein IJU77_14425 [Butyrivibrio sp.]|nr:hypothetical protein [Butyrivibrio sp.]
METLEIKINLDPVNDGAEVKNMEMHKKDCGALIIGTNGECRRVTDEEALDILDRIPDTEGEIMGNSDYIAIFNQKKIFRFAGEKFFIGSAVLFKCDKKGIGSLTGDEFEEAAKEFRSRLITLTGKGQDISAYELI